MLAALFVPAPANATLLGDVDGDGRVTVFDALRVLQTATHHWAYTSRDMLIGDVWPIPEPGQAAAASTTHPFLRPTGDGRLTKHDVAEVLKLAVGLNPPREIGRVVYTVGGNGPRYPVPPSMATAGLAEQSILISPWDLNFGPRGEIYFTEYDAHRIRFIDTDRHVKPFAGSSEPGFKDGTREAALFHHPEGIVIDPNGIVYVADTDNHAIRKITPEGVVSTLAGNGHPGNKDGIGKAAFFREPNGLCLDPKGNLYIADSGNHLIRRITPDGTVTTLAGTGTRGFEDGYATEAKLSYPTGLCYDPRDGGFYIADMSNQAIRKLLPTGDVVTLAGTGKVGHRDGPGERAQFSSPYGVDLDREGRVWIADWTNEAIRILYPDGTVKTAAGHNPSGYVDGIAPYVKFQGIMNVHFGPDGFLYIADADNHRIRAMAE